MELFTCKGCGKQVNKENAFCPNCGIRTGTTLATAIGSEAGKVVRKSIGLRGCFVMVALAFVAIGLTVFHASQSSPSQPSTLGVTRESADLTQTPASAASAAPQTTSADDLKLDFTWTKEDFGTMTANFTIYNNGPQSVKDLEVTCTHSGNSGTVIDSNTRTIYEIVPAHSKKRIPHFSMGFIVSQATKSACHITDFKPAE